ncbi:hypothetical protein QAD02_012437 [Eretmocerus hayati]|uniref:Uncharacterized protein n=1 Tax=Eretmocerus hayati TaxID=131215 RepID=A0ACC2P4F4_9HYME|nr:hypothetical protein QAD02_012437 [Eretmocerus hayati]
MGHCAIARLDKLLAPQARSNERGPIYNNEESDPEAHSDLEISDWDLVKLLGDSNEQECLVWKPKLISAAIASSATHGEYSREVIWPIPEFHPVVKMSAMQPLSDITKLNSDTMQLTNVGRKHFIIGGLDLKTKEVLAKTETTNYLC